MRCPFCHNADSRVIDSREADEGATTRRRRSCPNCNRRLHFGQDRRRRVVAPSSASRESMTRLSALWQNGQRTVVHLLLRAGPPGCPVDPPGDIRWMSRGEPEDRPVDGLTTL